MQKHNFFLKRLRKNRAVPDHMCFTTAIKQLIFNLNLGAERECLFLDQSRSFFLGISSVSMKVLFSLSFALLLFNLFFLLPFFLL